MRMLTKAILVGLAGLGLYRAWQLVNPTVNSVRDKTDQARARVEPAVRGAKDSLASARVPARGVANSLVGAPTNIVEAETDAAVDLSSDEPNLSHDSLGTQSNP